MKCFQPIRSLVTLKFPAIDNIFHIFFCCQKLRGGGGGARLHDFLTRGGASAPSPPPPPPPPWIRLWDRCIGLAGLSRGLFFIHTCQFSMSHSGISKLTEQYLPSYKCGTSHKNLMLISTCSANFWTDTFDNIQDGLGESHMVMT